MQKDIEEIPNCTLLDIFLWAIRRRSRLRVVGRSMLPVLAPDDEVFIDPRAYRKRLPQPGEILTLYHPHQPELKIVKRVDRVEPERGCFVLGDNPDESTDSRNFGWISFDLMIGKVVSRFDLD